MFPTSHAPKKQKGESVISKLIKVYLHATFALFPNQWDANCKSVSFFQIFLSTWRATKTFSFWQNRDLRNWYSYLLDESRQISHPGFCPDRLSDGRSLHSARLKNHFRNLGALDTCRRWPFCCNPFIHQPLCIVCLWM